jgi:hypothetical protein
MGELKQYCFNSDSALPMVCAVTPIAHQLE